MADHLAAVSRKLRARCDSILAVIWTATDLPGLAARVAGAGDVTPGAAAALLAPIKPTAIADQVARAWATTDAATLVEQRIAFAERALVGIVGNHPDGIDLAVDRLWPAAHAATTEGHALAAGLMALPRPDGPVAALWRCCDIVREHRGASHTNAWVAAGLDGCEVNLLSELWRNMPLRSVTCAQMAWSHDDADAALARLRDRGLVTDDATALTNAGRALREEIEVATDAQEASIVDALGDDADELLLVLEPWARAVMAALAGALPTVR